MSRISLLLAASFLAAGLLLPAAVLADGDAEPAGPSAEERAQVKAMVEELREEASALRGLPWKFEVPADLLTREQLRLNLMEMVEEEIEPEELERDTRILRRMRMLKPDEDPLQLALEMHGGLIAGYYHPKQKKLYIVEGMMGEGQKPIILHELIHALEDQYHDLEARSRRWEEHPDRLFAEKCLGEGSAEHARNLFQKANPAIAAAFMKSQANPEMMQQQIAVLRKVPAFMIVGTLLQYDVGPKLVDRVVGEDYPTGIAKLYENPPVSSEQYLHPDKWLGEKKDFPQKVVWAKDVAEAAGPDWNKVHDLPTGEIDLALTFDYFLGGTDGKLNIMRLAQGKYLSKEATKAAAGWDGGRTYWLEGAGGDIAWVEVLVFDTEKDATEAADATLESLKRAYAEQFTGGSWVEDESAEGVASRTAAYTTVHGPGRIRQDGTRVTVVDGLTGETLDAVWKNALETRIERDPRDTWVPSAEPTTPDPAKGALAGLAFADPGKGIGFDLPSDAWAVGEADNPMAVATLSKGRINGSVVAQALPMAGVPLEMVLPMAIQPVKAQFPEADASRKTPAKIAGADGFRVPLGPMAATGDEGVLYIGMVGAKLLAVTFIGPAAELEGSREELDAFVEGVVSVEG